MDKLQVSFKQGQHLLMTSKLRHSLKILQMSTLELKEHLEDCFSDNPMVEIPVYDSQFSGSRMTKKEFYSNRFQDRFLDVKNTEFQMLADVLMEQLQFIETSPEMKRIVEFLIGNVDQRGYVQISPDVVALRFRVSTDKVSEALHILEAMEPAGVGATSLQECLLLQIRRKDLKDELLIDLIKNYLSEISQGKLAQLGKKLNVTAARIQSAVDQLRQLNPFPGSAYANDPVKYLSPDITVEIRNGRYHISMEENMNPIVKWNTVYLNLLKRKSLPIQDKLYLNKHWSSAIWIAQCIEQRRLTVQKIAEAVFFEQEPFLRYGPNYLKSLSMKKIADSIGVHESTVSRAVNEKYVQTPWGILSLRKFFSWGVEQKNGKVLSSHPIKLKIKNIIQNENKGKPYSDQKLAEMLLAEGIEISRRTVTKYREEMNISSTTERRRYY